MKSITVTALTPKGTAGILAQLEAQENAPEKEKKKLEAYYDITTTDNPASVTMTLKNMAHRMMMGKGEGMKAEIVKGMGEAVIDQDYTVEVR